MIKAPVFLMLSLLALPLISSAATSPYGTEFDSRVQDVMYNPDDVVSIHVAPGSSTLIQLEEGETLEAPQAGLGIGDAQAWSIGVRGNNIFMKPRANSPDTNITLVTNRRTYALALESSPTPSKTAYIVRFIYPEPPQAFEPSSDKPLACTNTNGTVNVNYSAWGDESLLPHAAWDDGRFTCFRYPFSKDLPSIYRVTPTGEEVLTNMHTEDDVIVIHGVAEEYRFRLGDEVLGVKTESLKRATFNYDNSTIGGERRVTK
ncbi:TrbG/VirB9 family P-type conjugative transfer protein [Halomonas sp. 3D7M]|uniref:TrbG/VirB9 family P-type conjugative transfer protein n=1 Tax=Halomonas sp. 3D7M TaxID=2742617 RepID=UPI0018673284|nr:TrbG/VirB9 family P-type conjugative transfer protein [Halomonas sp. 3D7M]